MYRISFFLTVLALTLTLGCNDMTTDPASQMEPDARISPDSPALTESVAPANQAAEHTYSVTIENLTSNQILSPGIIASHTHKTSVFEVGESASAGVEAIAEGGNPAPLESTLHADDEVHEVVTTSGIGPGGSATFELHAKANANRLSVVTMLVCTNDGFTGLSGIKLPRGAKAETIETDGYDAGTEANDELSESLVDGCLGIEDGNAGTTTDAPIAHHSGIQGVGDLSAAKHGWTDPVARITVKRMKN